MMFKVVWLFYSNARDVDNHRQPRKGPAHFMLTINQLQNENRSVGTRLFYML